MLTATALREEIESINTYMEGVKGYSSCSASFRIEKDELDLALRLHDDFQSLVPWDKKYKEGYCTIASPDFSLVDLWSQLRRWPSREQRELHIAMQQIGDSIELAQQMKGVFAAEFVRQLQEQRSEYAGLLEDRRDEVAEAGQ